MKNIKPWLLPVTKSLLFPVCSQPRQNSAPRASLVCAGQVPPAIPPAALPAAFWEWSAAGTGRPYSLCAPTRLRCGREHKRKERKGLSGGNLQKPVRTKCRTCVSRSDALGSLLEKQRHSAHKTEFRFDGPFWPKSDRFLLWKRTVVIGFVLAALKSTSACGKLVFRKTTHQPFCWSITLTWVLGSFQEKESYRGTVSAYDPEHFGT